MSENNTAPQNPINIPDNTADASKAPEADVSEATKPQTALERLANLENIVNNGLIMSIVKLSQNQGKLQQRLDGIDYLLTYAVEYIGAMERIVVEDKALNKTTLKEALISNKIDSVEKQIADQVAAKKIKPVDIIDDQSLIVFHENDEATGVILNVRDIFAMSKLNDDLKSKFLGKKADDTVMLVPGRVLKILSIYDRIEPKTDTTESKNASVETETK